jgi:hypothetical protein
MATGTRSSGRKRATTSKATTGSAAAATELKCPECGRTFSRPAALGAHRRRAHGVAGTSQNARSRRSASAAKAASPTRPRRAQSSSRATGRSSAAGGGRADHDALLRALFPNGIPPREEVVAAVNDWLAQADRLARLS